MSPPTDTPPRDTRDGTPVPAVEYRERLNGWSQQNPLRVWRAELGGISQGQVAAEIGVSGTTIRMWERGHHQPPAHYLDKIAHLTRGEVDQNMWTDWWRTRPRLARTADDEERKAS
jgi:transcriptional regulator with XRE-family HTH domain